MIHIIADNATPEQVRDMLETLGTYIKLAVDVQQRLVAGGGEMHADCEAVLLEAGSQQRDVWGADWFPSSNTVRCQSLINLRPKQENRSLEIADPVLRKTIEDIVHERFGS